MRSNVTLLLVALAVALATAGCTSLPPAVSVVHDQVYPAAGISALEIEHQNGLVNVTGWDRDEIHVRVLEGRGIDNVSVTTAGGRMTVRTLPSGAAGITGPQARYEVSVPRALARVEVQTSNGQVQVSSYNGTVDAETSNGAIRLSGTRTFEHLSTSNGAIDAEIRALDTDARAATSNGAIRLALSPTIDAQVEAHTSNGQVTAPGLPLTSTTAGPTELRGTLGAGGPRLVVESSNGAITLGPL